MSLDLLTVEEMGMELRIGPRAVRKLISTGALPALKIGKRWYVRRAAIIERFEARENERAQRKRREAAELDRVVRAMAPKRTTFDPSP